jgi:hypothetical protein
LFVGAGSTGQQVALVLQDYTSKVMTFSHELQFKTIFKQFSSNLNGEFLSETLPRFSLLLLKELESLFN